MAICKLRIILLARSLLFRLAFRHKACAARAWVYVRKPKTGTNISSLFLPSFYEMSLNLSWLGINMLSFCTMYYPFVLWNKSWNLVCGEISWRFHRNYRLFLAFIRELQLYSDSLLQSASLLFGMLVTSRPSPSFDGNLSDCSLFSHPVSFFLVLPIFMI